jgi:DNA-binding response OmpR family regulator
MATRILLTPSVLLVNDALDEREMYARTLRAAGHHVITADDSVAAYQIATRRPPDVLVTDVRITRSINGLELTRRLKGHRTTSMVRIIVLITASRPCDVNVALKAGADSFLEKPVPDAVLKSEIRRLLPGSKRLWSRYIRKADQYLAGALGLDGTAPSTSVECRCPSCGGAVVYRARWPMLASDIAQEAIGRERLQYVSGWFCTNRACDFYQLSREPGAVY